MANFRVSNTPPPRFIGGPPVACAACKFHNENYKWYLVLTGVKSEMEYVNSGGRTVRGSADITFCEGHAREMLKVLKDVESDKTVASLKGKLLQAEAARARAEKRAEKAEAALHAMQDWIAGDDK